MALIAVSIPLYNKFGYGRRAALSALKYTSSEHRVVLIVIDDASPYYDKQDWNAWRTGIPAEQLLFTHYTENAGLTRAWNRSLQIAREIKADYTLCGNSDLLFTPGWDAGLLYHADRGTQLVGPVTNAPGPTNKGLQRVQNFYNGYRVTDDPDYLAQVARELAERHPVTEVVPATINGFCMLAKTETWWEGAYDVQHVFDPGHRMTGNEDELQRRWHNRGWKSGFVPSSFVFHYRAVSRGDANKHAGWFRTEDIGKPV